jgi:ubiquinone biosynthesis protein
MRAILYIPRFLVMAAVMWWFAMRYAFGRVGTWFVTKGEPRRRAVAHLRGRVLRKAFTALGATFVKLGQVLSTRPDLLDPEIIDELRKLQDRLPPFPFRKARRILEEDLGKPIAELYRDIDERPIAAASVAQVHRARLHDGAQVAVKILRPDVRDKVVRDATILNLFARMAGWHPQWRLSDPVGHLEHFEKGIID